MSRLTQTPEVKLLLNLSTITMLLCFVLAGHALAAGDTNVATFKDGKGWKLQVDGQDYFVKGMVWGYTPIGENHAYGLWGYPDDHIKKVLDYDFKLLQNAGVNTIRSFFDTPPRWVEYIYKTYGIMTIVNHTLGRYGVMVNGVWQETPDYSDPATRGVLKNEILDMVNKFKDTPGILMFALGNENNYGLEWQSNEIENLPVGEQHREKAKYLYSLYNEIIAAAKQLDSDHPYAIVNGDIQYIDLISSLCPDLDVLGVNSYRGKSFINDETHMWQVVKEKLDLPLVLTEFGSDAFNQVRHQEDQYAQADFLRAQWQEIYQQSYGHGEAGNAIGGCVFEWRDEWWKYRVEDVEDLDIHNKTATWQNGGYTFDADAGRNNMNEEWFGVMQLGRLNADDVAEAYPRLAFYTLKEIWQIDPYTASAASINQAIEQIDLDALASANEIKLLPEKRALSEIVFLEEGKIRQDFVSYKEDIGRDDSSDGQTLDLKFGFNPFTELTGSLTLKAVGNIPDKPLEEYYEKNRSEDSIEIYDFEATMELDPFDLNFFYHVPRYHWKYEGDFYGLLHEATDMEGMDIWEAHAPYGVEFVGKQALEGLKIVGGEEIYWGANPKWIAKYTFGEGDTQYTIMHSEDVDRADDTSGSAATNREHRATTASVKTTTFPGMTIEAGIISANNGKVDEYYEHLDNGKIKRDEIDFADTLGAKIKILKDDYDFGHAYVAASYAGLVADGGEPLEEFDTLLPYSEDGNKVELEAGIGIFKEPHTLYPRIFYRDNLVDANPLVKPAIVGTTLYPGLQPRNNNDDPFAVLDNRAALSAEIFYTYDPTTATDFYHWDNEHLEDAPLAFNIGFNYTKFTDRTDAYRVYDGEIDKEYAFDTGLPEEDVWKLASRVVLNPNKFVRLSNRFEFAYQQSTGNPEGGTREYYNWEFDYDIGRNHNFSGYVKKDMWGPYDYYRDFNVIFPWQYRLDYMYRLDRFLKRWVCKSFGKSASIGVGGIYRELDDKPTDDDYMGDHVYQITTFLTYEF
ncbi:MAG: glycoside hydrolase family 2 TIM barrel-domain containing protein [Desulfuromonadales bacterium]